MSRFKHFLRTNLPFIILAGVVSLFFYKTLFFGKIPFPGDLLLSEYNPWRHTSYFGYVPGSIPNKGQYFDVIRELYPWRTLVIDAFKSGHIPLWNPYNLSGTPLLANYQSQVFYPLSILYLLFPQTIAWTIMTILQPLLGCFFLFLYAQVIGLSKKASVISAMLFNFCAFASVWMEFTTVWHTILWLPLLLYLFEKGIRNRKFSLYQKVLFVFALFSSITGGHPQDFINCFLFFLIYAAVRLWTAKTLKNKEKISFITCRLSLVILIPFLLAAPQILPTVALFRESARVPHDIGNIIGSMLLQWWQVPMMFMQDFFGNAATKSYFPHDTYVGKALSIGTVGFILAILSFFQKKKTWHFKFFLWSALTLLILNVHTPLSYIFYRYPVPLLSTGTPTRNLFLFSLSLSVLAGFGFDFIAHLLGKQRIKILVIVLGILGILTAFMLLYPLIPGLPQEIAAQTTMKRALLFGSAFTLSGLAIILVSQKFSLAPFLLFPLIAGELLYGFIKFNPFVPTPYVFPSSEIYTYLQKEGGINRYWGYGTAQIDENYAGQYQVFSPEGTDPLQLAKYNALLQSTKDGAIAIRFTSQTRSDALITPGYGEKNLPDNRYRLRMMDMLGVKYILDRTDNPKDETTIDPNRFVRVYENTDGWIIYINKLAAPRFFLTSNIMFYDTDEDFEQKFYDPSFAPDRIILLEEKNKESIPELTESQGNVNLSSYTPWEISFQVSTEKPQMLFISDTYDKGWNAYVNNQKTTLYKTNYSFRSVLVPSGSSEVTMRYEPFAFTFGVYTAFAGMILFVTWTFAARHHEK